MEKFNIEKQENLSITSSTISADALIHSIYKGNNLPQDRRFLPTENGGVFKYFEIKDLPNHKEDKFYPVVKIGEKIVGLSELLKDPFNKKNLWIQFLSIDPNEQGNGYASRLSKEIFDFARKSGYSLEASRYTEDGFTKMQPVFEKLANEYSDVPFINKDKL